MSNYTRFGGPRAGYEKITAEEDFLLKNGVCKFDSSSGVSTKELKKCAGSVASLVDSTLELANS